MSRHRVRGAYFTEGYMRVKQGSTTSYTWDGSDGYRVYRDTCDDEVGYGITHGLFIEHLKRDIVPLSGERTVGSVTTEFSDYKPAGCLFSLGHLSLPAQSDSADFNRLLARTNPNRADADLVASAVELLREGVPFIFDAGLSALESGRASPIYFRNGNIRRRGRKKKKRGPRVVDRVAEGPIAWQFGIQPLISDLKALLKFQERVDKRIDEYQRIIDQGGIKRRFILGRDSNASTDNSHVINSVGGLPVCSGRLHIQTERLIWGTVRWNLKPGSTLPSKSDQALRERAIRAVYGLRVDPSTVWEVIPWSWLIDYFTSLGDFIEAHGNALDFYSSSSFIMKRITTKAEITRTSGPSWYSGGGMKALYETKSRISGSLSASTALTFMGQSQLANLGFLAIARAPRFSR